MDESGKLSPVVRAGLWGSSALALMSTGIAIGTGNWTALMVLSGVLATLLSMGMGLFYFWQARRRKRQSSQMNEELSQHTASAPRSVSDPGKLGRIEDLRKKFNEGVKAYSERGKDLYKLPWQVLVGESGGGKTEAIRHSQVRFPEGLTDYYQGVGGTLNMNWWFTDYAVILDTAGKMMFTEATPGETSEWKEFLNLLKRTRPNCPINGLILVIPADTLIKDTADDILRKARKIAQQLDVIQRVLDVRFPVFIVVSKCDMIGGFREFFDELTDPNLQHQMMGWTNAEPLDAPFRPEKVEEHLHDVAGRLRQRRLWLLRNPAPAPDNPSGRRADEVDSLYSFPHNLSLLGSRLRRYLETIFVAGEWSAKPLFLRGIYFSSSMREGAALDLQLAQFMGVPIGELSATSGKLWERERSYFLRDLFMEKVFRERGLVTRASNTRKMLRARQVALYGVACAALLTFLALAWFGLSAFQKVVGREAVVWGPAKDWNNGVLRASLGAVEQVEVSREKKSLGEYHALLAARAEAPVERSWIFPGVVPDLKERRKQAQRIVFEGGVVKPLLDATQAKFRADLSAAEYQPLQSAALAALIRLEASVLSGARPPLTTEAARDFLEPLQNFLTGRALAADSNLVAAMTHTYVTNEYGRGHWPMRWLSGAITNRPAGQAYGLADNPRLRDGLRQFLAMLSRTSQSQTNEVQALSDLFRLLRDYERVEQELFKAAETSDAALVRAAFQAMAGPVQALREAQPRLTNTALFRRSMSLTNAYDVYVEQVANRGAASVQLVANALNQALTNTQNQLLFQEMKAEVEQERRKLQTAAQQTIPRAELARLDQWGWNDLSFVTRFRQYTNCIALAEERPFQAEPLIADHLQQWRAGPLQARRDGAAALKPPHDQEARRVCQVLLDDTERRQTDTFFQRWTGQIQRDLAARLGFPLLRVAAPVLDADGVNKALERLELYRRDLESPALVGATNRPEVVRLVRGVKDLSAVARALIKMNGAVAVCSISLDITEDKTPAELARLEWRKYWDHVVVNDSEKERAYTTQVTKLRDVRLDERLILKVWQRSSEQERAVLQLDTWGPLRLLVANAAWAKPSADGLTWQLEVPIEKPPPGWPPQTKWENHNIPLLLKFELRLPKLSESEWPTKLPW